MTSKKVISEVLENFYKLENETKLNILAKVEGCTTPEDIWKIQEHLYPIFKYKIELRMAFYYASTDSKSFLFWMRSRLLMSFDILSDSQQESA